MDHSGKVVQYYRERLARYGLDHRSLDWGSSGAQYRRFAVLCEIGDVREASILDVGCGIADLYAYLQTRGFAGRYLGVDITPEMIAFARERFPALQFEARDVLALTGDAALHLRADYVLASGVFGLADWAFMGQAIQRMYALCEVGLAFNTLSAQAADREPGEFQADPGETLRFCQSLTPYVALRHDYMPHDFTVYMYRAQQFA